MFTRSELCREDLSDDPCLIDDVSDPPRKEPHRLRNRKCLAQRAVHVADQRERQLVLPSERAVTFLAIIAGADHVRHGVDELVIRVAKGTGFLCANRRAVSGVEEQHQRTLRQEVSQTDLVAVISCRGKVRCVVANFKFCHVCSPRIDVVGMPQQNDDHAIHSTKPPCRLQVAVRNQLVETRR